jgi:MFS superfamily sulfate permease-like transporter
MTVRILTFELGVLVGMLISLAIIVVAWWRHR